MDPYIEQDRLVRKAIETDSLVTKELFLRKKLLDHHMHIPKLKDFPYLVDVEYFCFEKDEDEGSYVMGVGQGDLLLTNGKNEYVAVEIKSSYVCFDGSDRVFYSKTSKLMDQVQVYMAYQRKHRPSAKVYGCGVTEQKIYWISSQDEPMEEYWWSSGPSACGPLRLPASDSVSVEDLENLPIDVQDLHAAFQEEALSRNYPFLIKYESDSTQKRLVYLSKCKQKRATISKEHLAQSEIQAIFQEYKELGHVGGHLVMYGLNRPTIITVYTDFML